MTTAAILAWGGVAMAALPAGMTLANLFFFRRAPQADAPPAGARPAVSVLIPARDEEAAIGDAIAHALAAAEGVEVEVIVLDDDSSDRTAEVVRDWSRRDARVRLAPGGGPPAGWCGKQHACWQLRKLAKHDVLTWIDADVHLQPGALRRVIALMEQRGAGLVSGFPKQVTGTWLEKLVVPLIPVVLLGYLPMWQMRKSVKPAYGAGCGQWFAARAADYDRAGGHQAIRASMHDGVTLPRAFRAAGIMTDVFDATDTAHCRMYRSAGQVWRGFAKNATEGLASPRQIGLWTVLLLGGFVLPWLMGAAWLLGVRHDAGLAVALGVTISAAHSAVVAWRFEQAGLSAVGRPLGIAALMLIQWQALLSKLLGRPAAWRGRVVQAS